MLHRCTKISDLQIDAKIDSFRLTSLEEYQGANHYNFNRWLSNVTKSTVGLYLSACDSYEKEDVYVFINCGHRLCT